MLFEGVILGQQLLAKRLQVRVENLHTARIQRAQRRLALHEVQGGAALGAGLGERQRAILELEKGERVARFLAGPVQASGDHEVQHEMQVAFQAEHNTLADARDIDDFPAMCVPDGRHRRPQKKGVEQPDGRQAIAPEQPLQVLDVDRDVGKLGH